MTTILYIPEIFGVSIEVYLIITVLAIPTYFFWRWLLKRYIKDNSKRKVATWTWTIITAPLLYAGIFFIWIMSISYYPSHDFDRQKWFDNVETRYELSEDIIDSEMLIGKTESEVRQLLGDDYYVSGQDKWSYYLGFRPQLIAIDPDVLDIYFINGKVVRVGQHTT